MLKKCIIFGAGFYGKGAYYKLKNYYDILYYADNNSLLWGKDIGGIPIVSMEKMMEVYACEKVDIIICSQAYFEMANQLTELGIEEYYCMLEGFLYHFDKNDTMVPIELSELHYYKKECDERNILFVQNTACIRTHKIAAMMKNKGYKVFLLYTIAPPESNNESFCKIYDKVYTVFTPNALIDFVNNSEFDIVHSSNEPDSLTNYLLLTNKKIVFDTHDMMSLRGNDNVNALVLEYLANTRSAGVIYTSKGVLEIAKKKFGLENQKTFVLENLILNQIEVKKFHEKLSSLDGELHCVYEGGIQGGNKMHHRYFEDIWRKLTDCGIHIHYYSQSDYDYCVELSEKSPYLHFEGNMGSEELASEMTKYDCGLAIFNVNDSNRAFLETGTANKVYEYINSGLPVILGDINSYVAFVEGYHVGIKLDFDGDIMRQLQDTCKIIIEKDFLQKHKLTMDSYSDELVQFYSSVIEG